MRLGASVGEHEPSPLLTVPLMLEGVHVQVMCFSTSSSSSSLDTPIMPTFRTVNCRGSKSPHWIQMDRSCVQSYTTKTFNSFEPHFHFVYHLKQLYSQQDKNLPPSRCCVWRIWNSCFDILNNFLIVIIVPIYHHNTRNWAPEYSQIRIVNTGEEEI